jgi:hypothetical protein
MKRLNPLTNNPFVRSFKRKDGYYFSHYNTTRIRLDGFFEEVWLNKKALDKQKTHKRKYKSKNPQKSAEERATKLKRTPKWLSDIHRKAMNLFYQQAKNLTKQTGVLHHVDHIVPLNGKTVSGLHVPWNLQVITAKENCSKSNKF